MASERGEFLRTAWLAMVDPERPVFADGCRLRTSLSPVHRYFPRGERSRLSVPRTLGRKPTLLASMTLFEMGPSLALEGP